MSAPKLPKTIAEMTDEQLQEYVAALLPGGAKRKLAEEVLRLRKEARGENV